MQNVTVREFATITKAQGLPIAHSLDHATLPQSAWEALLQQAKDRQGQSALVKPIVFRGELALRLQQYVGVVELPGQICLEILPKTANNEDEPEPLRRLLMKMLEKIGALPKPITHQPANLRTSARPLLDVMIAIFLSNVHQLVMRGLRSDYNPHEETLPFLRGKWRVQDQLRQPPGRDHLFEVTFDEYLPDRAENRLIHAALQKIATRVKGTHQQRLARELRFVFQDIPPSVHHAPNFQRWRNDRNMAHYRPVRPWCELILGNLSPLCYQGGFNGISMLFPMEQVFELYVAKQLRTQISPGFTLRTQVQRKHLVRHENQNWFRLKPDLLIEGPNGSDVAVLDTKWKRLDSRLANGTDKYELSSADMYQLFAYGHKYLAGAGKLFLIFPAWQYFQTPLPMFSFSEQLSLWAVPYYLESDQLCLPGDSTNDWHQSKVLHSFA